MTPGNLERRSREARARTRVRAWEYRQRDHAKGAWFRLRRALAHAREIYSIGDADAAMLLEEGMRPEPVGACLEPPRLIILVPAARMDHVATRRRLLPRLDACLMSARAIALVPWEGATQG